MKQWEEKTKRQFLQSGIIASVIDSFHLDVARALGATNVRQPLSASDFIPQERREMTIEEAEVYAERFFKNIPVIEVREAASN